MKKIEDDKDDWIKYLTLEQLVQLREFVGMGAIELEFDGDDLVLNAGYLPVEGDENYSLIGAEQDPVIRVETVGKVSLRKVINDSLLWLTDDPPCDAEKATRRIELLSFAGHLRDAVRFLEEKAESLSDEKWGDNSVATLLLVERI